MRLKIILFNADSVGNTSIYLHDFPVIYTKSGFKMVLDVTGWQFGIKDYLFAYDEYEREYIDSSRAAQRPIYSEEEDFYYETAFDPENSKRGRTLEVLLIRNMVENISLHRLRSIVELVVL